MSSVRRNVPWCTPAIKRKCREKQRLYHHPRNWEAFKAYQRTTVAALRSTRWEKIRGMLNDGLESGNHKPFWQYVKSQHQDNCGVSPLKRNGELHSDSKDRAQILNDQFFSVFTKDDHYAGTVLEGPSLPPLAGLNISEKGVAKLLKEIDPSKTGGPDEVPYRMLKELADDMAPILTDIYRQSLSTGVLLNSWKTGYLSLIFKRVAVWEAENYRPVGLTCIPYKILEHIICSHLRRHLDIHGALSPRNHGFRKHHSCDTQLIITIQDLLTQKDSSRRWRPGFCQGVWQSPSGPVDWGIPEWPHTGNDYRQQYFRPGPSPLWRPARNSAGTIIIVAIHQRPTISRGSRNRSTLHRGWLLNLLEHWDHPGSDTIPRRSGCIT